MEKNSCDLVHLSNSLFPSPLPVFAVITSPALGQARSLPVSSGRVLGCFQRQVTEFPAKSVLNDEDAYGIRWKEAGPAVSAEACSASALHSPTLARLVGFCL